MSPKRVIWHALKRKAIVEVEVKAIMEMYNRIKTAVRLKNGRPKWFDITV